MSSKEYVSALEQENAALRETAKEFDMFMKAIIKRHGKDESYTILAASIKEAAKDPRIIKISITDPPLPALVYELCSPLPRDSEGRIQWQ